MKITVVGAGGTGFAVATDMMLSGHEVKIFDNKETAALKDSSAVEKIRRIGFCEGEWCQLPKIEKKPKEAIENAEVIFITAVANRHKELCDCILPYLQDGQAVCFFNGNCGSIYLKQKLESKDVVVGETLANYSTIRYKGNATIQYAMPVSSSPKAVAAFPSSDSVRLVAMLEPCYNSVCYPQITQKTVFELSLSAPNVTTHLIASVVNICAIERFDDFRLYLDGLSPSVLKLIAGVVDERNAIFEKLGFNRAIYPMHMLETCMNFKNNPDPKLTGFYLTTGPDSVTHRYISEDAFATDSLLVSLGKAYQVPTPLLSGALAIASKINDYDYEKYGLTLGYLGIEDLSPQELVHYLETGEK